MRITVITESNLNKVEEMYNSGKYTYKEMAEKIGISAFPIAQMVKILINDGRIRNVRKKGPRKKEVTRDFRVTVMLTEKEFQMLTEISKSTGLSNSDIFRNLFVDYCGSLGIKELTANEGQSAN